MKRFFRNLNWKNILIISLALVLGVGAIAGVSSIVKNEKTTLSSLEFKRGALNDLGFYIESDTSIYTKDLIKCQGLEIEPDFETLGEYQVYYYDSNKQFVGKTDKIDSQTDGVYVKGDNYRFAKYCRIVITPEVPKEEDGHAIDDYKIKFYEVAGIAGKYKISVNKEQKMSFEHLENYASKFAVKEDTIYIVGSDNQPVYADANGMSTTTCVTTTIGSDTIGLVFDKVPANCNYIITNAANGVLSTGTLDVSGRVVVFQMPQNGVQLILNFDSGCAPAVYNAK